MCAYQVILTSLIYVYIWFVLCCPIYGLYYVSSPCPHILCKMYLFILMRPLFYSQVTGMYSSFKLLELCNRFILRDQQGTNCLICMLNLLTFVHMFDVNVAGYDRLQTWWDIQLPFPKTSSQHGSGATKGAQCQECEILVASKMNDGA